MLVKDVLKSKGSAVISVRPDDALWSVLRRFRRHQIGALVVLDDQDQLIGMLTERDLVNGLTVHGKELLDLSVHDAMSRSVPTCRMTDSVAQIMRTMTDHRTRHLPVVEDGMVRGLISIGDVVKARLDDVELENKVLRDLARSRA